MLKEKKRQGFTIIEVVIVLVIAAIIMLMVFLVVPYLQRTQRDSRRQNDARRLLTAFQQYSSNHSGTNPTKTGDIVGSGSGYITETFNDPSTNKSYTVNFKSGAQAAPTSSNVLVISTSAQCNDDGSIADGTGTVVSIFQENGKAVCIGG